MPAFETPAAPQRKNAPRRKALFDKLRRARRLRRGRAFFVLTRRGIHGMINYAKLHGEMSERFMELVLKTSDPKGPGVRISLSPPERKLPDGAGLPRSSGRLIYKRSFTMEKYPSGEGAPLLRE